MSKWTILITVVMILTLLLACGPVAPEPATTPTPEVPTPTPLFKTPSGKYLTPNPVESSMPIYGGILKEGFWMPRTFDAHQLAGYGPCTTLLTFNQLVMFDINYKETVPETIIGDLAESWETSPDGMAITFKLRRGVKWHDGVPFTADDVAYSLDKMNDVNHSAISGWFPAYESSEKIDEYTVKVHLKYPSAGFLLALAQGESQIQPFHLAGTNDQSVAFMVGTGPFILTDYLPQVHLKWKRNPDYFKKDQYGNQLPYLDGVSFYNSSGTNAEMALVARRLDIKSAMTGLYTFDSYQFVKNGAPDLLYQTRQRYSGLAFFINLSQKPLDDIRVRRAMALVLDENEVIIGSSGDVAFGIPGAGILHPDWGLPKEEVAKLMGWDKPMPERIAEAQQLMAEAGYPDGFKLDMMASGAASTLAFAGALRQYLKIDANVPSLLGDPLIQKRLAEDKYGTYTHAVEPLDPARISIYFASTGYANYSHYSNPDLDKMLAELDHIIDQDNRREAILAIERILLTELPALPTGCFPTYFMPYYPWVKNLRWNNMSYSNANRMEDVWIDESLRVK